MATGNETDRLRMEVSEELDYAAMKDAVQLRHGLCFMFATILFFQFVNWIIKSQGPPKSLVDDEWKWRNLYVSWVHASITSSWTILSCILYPELFSNLMQHINYFTYFCICFATGYFFYDFLDMLVNNKCLAMWEVVLHHVAVAGMSFYNILIKSHIGFNIIAFLVEFNSLFLHWRKLLQMVKTRYDSRKYVIIKYLNLFSFVVFRFGPLALITLGCFYWGHKVSLVYHICICAAMFFMDVLNVILFWRLFKSDMLRGKVAKGSVTSVCSNIKRDCQALNGHDHHSNGLIVTGNNNFSESVKTRVKQE